MEATDRIVIRAAMYCFKYSLIIGTLFFLTFCVTRIDEISFCGFFYICVAVVINSIMLLVLLLTLISSTKDYLTILKTIGLLLLNIPIALFYFWVLTEFLHF